MKKVIVLALSLLIIHESFAQKLKKADRVLVEHLQKSIAFLADDKLEGRRTGSAGEKLAADFISAQFKAAGLQPKGTGGSFLQAFEINEGKAVKSATLFMVNGKELKLGEDYFPLAFSANGNIAEVPVATSLSEKGVPWFKDIEIVIEENQKNPHFDIYDYIKKEAVIAAGKGATALVVFNSEAIADKIDFEKKDNSALAPLPVLYLTKQGRERHLKDASAIYDMRIKVELGEARRTGHNVVGYLDNKAPNTVIIGAHYDHLGYGEDGGSLLKSGAKEIHNGADDNASGTAALIELAKWLPKSKQRNNNYILIAFSGEELGLLGSKYFTEHPTIDLSSANYMINMDMIGRMKEEPSGVSIGGYGTSPLWAEILYAQKKVPFTIHVDSSGTGPSDHTSFYRKKIPVLFFFTGIHGDYHKPSDDADKINYIGELQVIQYIKNLVEMVNKKGKLPFTPTREVQMSASASFSVTLGIMPDYAFSGNGVRVDGVSEGRPAQKAGIKTGDVIVKLGEYNTGSMDAYMKALNKFKKGQQTQAIVKRGTEELKLEVVF